MSYIIIALPLVNNECSVRIETNFTVH